MGAEVMPRRRGRPAGSSTDDYAIGVMFGLLWLLGPSDARDLARLAIKLGQVPCGGTEASRVDRLARKISASNFRADTKEWRAGFGDRGVRCPTTWGESRTVLVVPFTRSRPAS